MESKKPDGSNKALSRSPKTDFENSEQKKSLKLKDLPAFISRHQNFIILALVFGLVLFLRLWQINSLPPGLNASEKVVLLQIKSLSFDNMWLGHNFYQAAYIYLGFLVTKLFGFTVVNLRIMSALVGSATVVLTYIFISSWFSKKIAIFTAFLLAISAVHITFSRLIMPEIMMPLVLLGLFICLTEAYRSKNIWLFGISGFLVSFGFYTSPAFLMLPFLFLGTGIYFYTKNRRFLTSYRQELVIAFLGFLAGFIPYTISFISGPGAYLTYYGFNRSIWQIIVNLSQIPKMLVFSTTPNYFYNLGAEPLLDPFIAVTSFFGIVLAVFEARRRKYFFLLSWLFLFILYASLKRGVQISDLLGMLPVIFTFSALALDYVIDKWFATFPFNKRAQVLAIAIISIFLAFSALYNFNRYFIGYKDSVMVHQAFSEKLPDPYK